MTVDANGSIHDQGNGRFAGHTQAEADADTVLPSTAGLLTSIRTTPRLEPVVEPVDYEALAAHIRELAATAEPHPMTCCYCGATPRMGQFPCPASPDHAHYVEPLPRPDQFTSDDWTTATWTPTDEDPDIVQLDGPGTLYASILTTRTDVPSSADYDLPHTLTSHDWEIADAATGSALATGTAATLAAAQRAAQAAWHAHRGTRR